MKKQQCASRRDVHFFVTLDEYALLEKKWKSSTNRYLGEYIRFVLLNKPITVLTRNQSFDDFIAEIIVLRTELKGIGTSIDNAVYCLQPLDNVAQIQSWLGDFDGEKARLNEKLKEIKLKMDSIADIWLQ